jgi:hypothetical protein
VAAENSIEEDRTLSRLADDVAMSWQVVPAILPELLSREINPNVS